MAYIHQRNNAKWYCTEQAMAKRDEKNATDFKIKGTKELIGDTQQENSHDCQVPGQVGLYNMILAQINMQTDKQQQ